MKIFIFILYICIFFSTNIASAKTIEEILNRGSIKVCALSDRLPFSSKNGKVNGLQIELATEISKELNVDLEVIWLRYRFHARKAGCDLMMEAVAKKDDDADKKDIEGAKPLTRASDSKKSKLPPQVSVPIIRYETYLVGRSDIINNKNNLASVKNLNIGVMRGTWSHMLMQKYKIKYRTKFETEAKLIQGLKDREIDAAFISSPQYWWYLKNNPNSDLKYIDDFDFTRDVALNVGILMRGADKNTVDIINGILKKLLKNNIIQDIYSSYGIKYVTPTES